MNELKDFESQLYDLAANVEYQECNSTFQQELRKVCKRIRTDDKLWIPADKSNNYYRMDPHEYIKLRDKEIHKEFIFVFLERKPAIR